MADCNATVGANAPQSPNGRNAARKGLAPGKKEVQLRLADGTPLSGWLTSPGAFDAAVAQALQQHEPAAIRVQCEEAL